MKRLKGRDNEQLNTDKCEIKNKRQQERQGGRSHKANVKLAHERAPGSRDLFKMGARERAHSFCFVFSLVKSKHCFSFHYLLFFVCGFD